MEQADVVVIGAGFGGLSAALHFAEAGRDVVLFEALNYPGGCASTFERFGQRYESGATMFGAFFIVTDPVTSAVSVRGRLVYGAMIGLLVYLIRFWGNYPDAVAFAVLIMNFAAPFIDYYTQPRTYGHGEKPREAR